MSYFYFVFISKGSIVSGERSRVFFFSFYAFFFLYPCLLVLRVIIHQGLFNCQMQQKIIRPLLFPAPTLAFSSNKSSLCWDWSSFHRDPSSSHKLGTLFYFISKWPLTNAGRLGMLQLMLCPGWCCPSIFASLTALMLWSLSFPSGRISNLLQELFINLSTMHNLALISLHLKDCL